MRARFWIILVVVVTLVVIGATTIRRGKGDAAQPGDSSAASGRSGGQGGRAGRAGMAPGPMPVAAAAVQRRDMPIYLRGLGSVTPINTVTVKSRVDGELVQVNFQEGQEVKKGELLAVIDPRPFQVQLDTAQANLAKDVAQLNDARLNLERYRALYQEKVIAKQQLDTQAALVGQLEGALGADQAAIDSARLNLAYTRITAPVTGRVGLRMVDPGNIVHAADTNGMLVITQMDPISVIFTLPEDYIASIVQHMRKGALKTEAWSRDDQTKIADGQLFTLNNEIDPTTGTDKLRANFPNPQRTLWPNQFVNIRLLLDVQKDALVVPIAGILRGTNNSTFVYVVGPDQKVKVRPIKVDTTEGNVSSVEGLNAGELVVTDGQDKLRPDALVQVQQANASGAAAAQPGAAAGPSLNAPPPSPGGARGHGRGQGR
ncbi:MAG: MdtA/MuxA family multidrug efflux RND transporter periplasmic adaptor subunit [Acidobacteria bacterium]|nr:MdtA/MuxA family multidrug efflux RND transporter periplasmic adaptor subunit [Acidobacteriota bacterium]